MKNISKPQWGIKPPLFDRIKKLDDGESYHQLLDMDGLLNSLQQELSIMMDSRVAIRKVEYDDHIGSIPIYGAPDYLGLVDFSYFDAQNNSQWKDIQLYLKTAIETVEPRLTRVITKVARFNADSQEVYVEVTGQTKVGKTYQNVVFPVALSTARQGRAG